MRVAQRELGQRLPDATLYVSVNEPDYPFAFRSGLIPVPAVSAKKLKKYLRSIPFVSKIPDVLLPAEFLLSLVNPDFSRAKKISKHTAYEIVMLGAVDAVIDISGFAYGDAFRSTSHINDSYAWVDLCKRKGKKYIFLPQAWGSFDNNEIASLVKKMCLSAQLICSRDDQSSNHLQQIPVAGVRKFPDIVFNFKGETDEVGRALLRNVGFKDATRPKIALVPNMRIYERTNGLGASNEYVKFLVKLSNFCIDKLGVNLLVMPNEICTPGTNRADDRFLCGLIVSLIKKNENCITTSDYYKSETIKSILGQMDMVIASRFHSLVFALSQGVPVLAIGWSHKYRELLSQFDAERYVVDHDNLDVGEVFSIVSDAWLQKEKTRKRILDTIPKLQAEVELLFDEVASSILDGTT